MLKKLGPLDADQIADLRPYLESVPDPRSRRGRWYSLTAILLVCACAAVCGAKSIDELAEFGERATDSLLASLGVRRHLLGWRRSPKPVTLGRVLQALDGDALDRAVGAYLADRHRITASADVPEACSRQVIAVDGKVLKGSARSIFFIGLIEPFVGLGRPGALGMAISPLPSVVYEASPPSAPRRLGRRLGSANKSLCRAMPAKSSVARTVRTRTSGAR
ncbi:transposase family protein [Streptomyces sp. NPDC096153]|uniref:transposase family protein n=1 Tax=Streptomyces sp. NPDC096153 TaxID=3155548 RepID=UPI00331E4C29